MNRQQLGYLSWLCRRYELYKFLSMPAVILLYNNPKGVVEVSFDKVNKTHKFKNRKISLNNFPKQEDVSSTLQAFGAVRSYRFEKAPEALEVYWDRVALANFLKIKSKHVKKALL